MPDPRISVVIPIYNGQRYLDSAVASILNQTFDQFELIAVDDGSTDDSKAILDRHARNDPRVKVISRPNTGIVGALNDGIEAAKGEFIARMDADDLASPNRFETQLAYLQANPSVACLGSMVCIIDPDGDVLGNAHWLPMGHSNIEQSLLTGNGGAICHPVAMMPRAALVAAGAYRIESQWAEDLDLFLRLADQGTLENLPDILLQYRMHLGSVNHQKAELQAKRVLEIIQQAHRHRDLQPPDRLLPESAARADHTELDHQLGWGWLAYSYKHYEVAKKHAWSVLRRRPLNAKAWSLMKKSRQRLANQKQQANTTASA